jgi:hypothetical protein
MAELKAAKEEMGDITQEIQQDLPQPEESPGLMARPQPQEAM